MQRLAIITCVVACSSSPPPEMVAPPSVALHEVAPLVTPPPPPPPPPKGLGPDDPGEVPAAIARYIARYPDANAVLIDPQSTVTRRELGHTRAAMLMVVLNDPVSWGDGEPGCVSQRFVVQFRDGRAPLDLDIDPCGQIYVTGVPDHAVMKPAAIEKLRRLVGPS